MADVSVLLKKLEQGTATQEDLQKYASRLGQNAGREIADMLEARGTADTAQWILQQLRDAHDEVTEYADSVQKLQYEAIGVGLAPVSPAYDHVTAENLTSEIERIVAMELQRSEILKKTEAYAQDVADRHMDANAAAASGAGLEVKVSRKYDGRGLRSGTKHAEACRWCLSRECTNLSYQEAYAKGAFERHEGCHCVITYTNKRGQVTVQSAKGGWTSAGESGNIEVRKEYGLEDTPKSGFLPSDKYEMPVSKIRDFLLKPEAKHANEFFDVGYTPNDVNRLNRDLYIQYHETKAYDKRTYQDGSERFSIDMTLGITKMKPFQTVWQRNTPDSKPRFITAHRKDDDRVV